MPVTRKNKCTNSNNSRANQAWFVANTKRQRKRNRKARISRRINRQKSS